MFPLPITHTCLTAQPIANILTAQLIDTSPLGGNGSIHNTCLLFTICSGLTFFLFVWSFFMIDEENDRIQFEVKFDQKVVRNAEYDNGSRHPLQLLFDLKNVKFMIMAFAKRRSNYVRAQILLVCLALFNFMFIQYSPLSFLFQFTEDVYNWDASTYSNVMSIGLFIDSVIGMIAGYILIEVFHSLH